MKLSQQALQAAGNLNPNNKDDKKEKSIARKSVLNQEMENFEKDEDQYIYLDDNDENDQVNF